MSEKPLKILLAEDNEDHRELVRSYLEDTGKNFSRLDEAITLKQTVQRLGSNDYDVVLLDLGLPDSRGLDTLIQLLPEAGNVPVIVLTALDDRETGIKAVQHGAQDYLVKNRLDGDLLQRSIRYAMERKRVLSELERSNQELSRFAHQVAHDLKSPLRSIVTFCQFIEQSDTSSLDEETRESLEFAVSAGERMTKLVDSLLHFALVGHSKEEFTQIDCASIFQESLNSLSGMISESQAEITHDPLPKVNGNETLLFQLFQNLIENAIRYSGPQKPVIHLAAERKGEEWVFSLSDNGVGIPADQHERIFAAFEKMESSTRDSGFGIGLATCKRVVELHGGRIWVESESGNGSTFRFTLPSVPAETVANPSKSETLQPTEA